MKTAVIMLGEAFRQWQKDWESYKGIGNKPKSFDEFIITFIDLEKEQIMKAYCDGFDELLPFLENEYYNQTYNE